MPQVTAHPKPLPPLAGAAILAVLALGIYWPALHSGFIWDDNAMLTGNDLVKLPEGLPYIWFSTVPVDYFPLTLSSFWVEWRLWGLSPAGYHLTNVMLHVGSALVLWRGLAQLRLPGAFLAALLFLVHPVNVESVAWIAERKNTLSMLFFLMSLLLYLRFDERSKVQSPKSKVRGPKFGVGSQSPASRSFPSAPLYWLSLLAFLCSLLSKTAGVMLPFVLLGLAWWRRGRVGKTDLLRALPFFGVALVLGLVTIWFQYHRAISTDVIHHRDAWVRLAGAGHAVWFYLWKAVWPINLVFVYPEWKIEPRAYLAWLPDAALVVAFAVLWRFRNGWGRAGLFGLGYFTLVLFPVLGFFSIYFQKYSFVADHWQYFALPAVAAGAAGALSRVQGVESEAQSPKFCSPRLSPHRVGRGTSIVGVMLCGAMLLVLGVLTWRQQLAYKDEETLWLHTLTQDPKCWMANNNLGTLFQERGQVDEAVSRYRQSIQTQPSQVEAYNNLGLLLFGQGKYDEAMAQFKLALAANPNVAMTHLNIGNVFVKRGQESAAFAEFQTAARLRPDLAEAHNNLGCLLSEGGKPLQAAAEFREALKWRPQYPEAMNNLDRTLAGKSQEAAAQPDSAEAHYQMAVTLGARKQTDEAIRHLREAIRLKPDWIEALNNLAWMLATQPDQQLRDGPEAVRLATRTVELTRTNNAGALDTLAAACAEVGHFSQAQRVAQSALRLALAFNQTNLVEQIQGRLSLYQRSQPFREAAITNQ